MKTFLVKHLWQVLAVAVIVLLAALSCYLYYSYNLQVNNLKQENEVLNQKYLKSEQDSKLKDTQLDEKNKEIEDLQQARNSTTRSDVESDTEETIVETPSQQSFSIYDHINGSDDFINKIRSALDALSANDGEHFQMVSSQVSQINEYDNYGGYQEKRNIYIGADANPAITGSLIAHEARHVYNVYVDKIWSYHTKEQELPCYEAELLAAQRLGAPVFFISSIESEISYWQSQ